MESGARRDILSPQAKKTIIYYFSHKIAWSCLRPCFALKEVVVALLPSNRYAFTLFTLLLGRYS